MGEEIAKGRSSCKPSVASKRNRYRPHYCYCTWKKTFHKVVIQWKLCACILKNFQPSSSSLETAPHPQTRGQTVYHPACAKMANKPPRTILGCKDSTWKTPSGKVGWSKHQGQPKWCNQTMPFCLFLIYWLNMERKQCCSLAVACFFSMAVTCGSSRSRISSSLGVDSKEHRSCMTWLEFKQ